MTLEQMIESFEGRIPWMYLDGPGNVTCGCGFLLPDAYSAIGLYGNVGASDIWAAVKACEPGHPAEYYKSTSWLSLTDTEIDAELSRRIAATREELARKWPVSGTWPQTVLDALIDMCYNLGVSGWLHDFPLMVIALGKRDWPAAAAQCARKGVQPERNHWTREMILSAELIPSAEGAD